MDTLKTTLAKAALGWLLSELLPELDNGDVIMELAWFAQSLLSKKVNSIVAKNKKHFKARYKIINRKACLKRMCNVFCVRC